MKKLFILALLLGLTGCGDNNQSDTQTNNQTSTLQKAEIAPAVASYSMAASPRTFGAVAPLAGWDITKSTVMGASTLIDAAKGNVISAALVTPNAKQVAEVLRGGAAGIALSIAVDQLLGAVDWVMDPANNQIKYKTTTPDDPSNNQYRYRWDLYEARWDCYSLLSCVAAGNAQQDYSIKNKLQPEGNRNTYDKCVFQGTYIYCTGKSKGGFPRDFTLQRFSNPLYNPTKTLPLEAVAEQVITNADAGSLDAQVATNLAAQNILNDVVQAEHVVQELENNARDKDPRCKAIIGEMERLATDVEFRYNDLLLDRHDLYRNYRSIKNAHWSYGSWDGHIIQYNKVQGTLKSLVTQAVIEGCTVSPYVRKWSEQKSPAQPLPKE